MGDLFIGGFLSKIVFPSTISNSDAIVLVVTVCDPAENKSLFVDVGNKSSIFLVTGGTGG